MSSMDTGTDGLSVALGKLRTVDSAGPSSRATSVQKADSDGMEIEAAAQPVGLSPGPAVAVVAGTEQVATLPLRPLQIAIPLAPAGVTTSGGVGASSMQMMQQLLLQQQQLQLQQWQILQGQQQQSQFMIQPLTQMGNQTLLSQQLRHNLQGMTGFKTPVSPPTLGTGSSTPTKSPDHQPPPQGLGVANFTTMPTSPVMMPASYQKALAEAGHLPELSSPVVLPRFAHPGPTPSQASRIGPSFDFAASPRGPALPSSHPGMDPMLSLFAPGTACNYL